MTDVTGGYTKQLPQMQCGICQRIWDRMTPPPCEVVKATWQGQVVHTQAELDAFTSAHPNQSRWKPYMPPTGP